MIVYRLKNILWLYGKKNNKQYLIPFIYNRSQNFIRIIKEGKNEDIPLDKDYSLDKIENLFILKFGLKKVQVYDPQTLYLIRLQTAIGIMLTKEEKSFIKDHKKRSIDREALDNFIDSKKMNTNEILLQTIRFKLSIKKATKKINSQKTPIDEKDFIF